jgi:hypothetical protein
MLVIRYNLKIAFVTSCKRSGKNNDRNMTCTLFNNISNSKRFVIIVTGENFVLDKGKGLQDFYCVYLFTVHFEIY